MSGTAVSDDHFRPEKSPYDHRDYKYLTLDNGLRVILVHDEQAIHSAAAVGVNAGHFQDPEEMQGLAHFLEHMLFMGTAKYPQPSDYGDFISQHGGHHNAWTGTEHTSFYFDIQPEYFSAALDRFSQFFIAPLFEQKWIDKELQAVESEYRMKLTDELRRLYQVHKETANPEHPFTKFSVGNAHTLADSDQQTTAQRLRQFFSDWYKAEHLSLVLAGPQSLSELQQLATEWFSVIPEGGAELNYPQVPLYTEQQLGVRIHVRPLKQACRLILSFPFPSINDDYPYKTTSFLAHILGYEGQGSICAELRQRGWATALSAGGGVSGSNFKDFNFNIQLTENGLEQIDEVICLIFNGIALVKEHGLKKHYYAERQQMIGLAFRFQEGIRTLDLASQLAINMLHYEPEHSITGDYLMRNLNIDKAHELLQVMQPEKARVTLIHQSLPVNQTTELYETAYSIHDIDEEKLAYYASPLENSNLRLPPANPFIPERQNPLPLREPVRHKPALVPSVASLQAWHLQDAQFRVPKGHLYLSLSLPHATVRRSAFACSRLWCELVLDKLNERCYDAEIAGINFNLYPQQSGISIHLSGFSEQQPALLSRILSELTNFEFAEQHFNAIQHSLYHNWLAVNRHKPINHLFTILNQELQRGCFTAQGLASAMPEITEDFFRQQLPILFSDMNVRMLIHGDWPVETARHLTSLVTQKLRLKRQPAQGPLREVRLLEPGKRELNYSYLPHPDKAVALFCQGQSQSVVEKASFLLLNHLVSPGFFSQLRTEQQLGYMVGSSYVPMNGRPGLLFYVQSPHAELATMESAIDQFIQQFCEQLPTLDNDSWEDAKQSVLTHLEDKDPSLRIRAQRLWTSIGIEDYNFDLADKLAAEVSRISLQQLVQFAVERMLQSASSMFLTCEPIKETEDTPEDD
ncbi:peptidase M16 [Aliidiomarina minuta]|uniref:Protease 3 n=1 Tax=Aliidiomarina minuta TaxID=880057 RepID=A0A432W5C2_9GAMM|nr:insulinase family protein [Aliidiomarina minuta]RUO25242.1 peptidase M16 [Aliidiomarina minuta]